MKIKTWHPWGSHPQPATTDGGSAGFAGAKTCLAGDGLSK